MSDRPGWGLLLGLLLALVVVGLAAGVVAGASPPTAEFSHSPTTPNPDETVTLDAGGSSDNGSIVSYEWDTDGDGNYGYAADADDGQTAQISFDTGGTYTVGLRVTDDQGNTDTKTVQITVDNPAPTAAFEHTPATPTPDDTITLDAGGSSDSDGSIVRYEWDTDGDGNYGYASDADDGQTAQISFETGGTYTVGLKVTDNGETVDTVTKQITVDNPGPTAAFEYKPDTPNPDDTITLDAGGSSDSDGSIVRYEWDTDGDGNYGYAADADDGQTAQISFETGGTYTVGLRVIDNGEKTDTVTKQITVDNPRPTAAFDYTPATPTPDDTITLDAGGSSDSDGTITRYEWDTDGDGNYGYASDADDGETAQISFDTGGTYTVGLRVTDNGETVDTVTKQITVDNPAPTATFDHTPAVPAPGEQVVLDAGNASDGDGSIVRYEWDTDGDGNYGYASDADDGRTTRVTFESAGDRSVGLRVTDNGDRTATVVRTIPVGNAPPEVAFTVSPEQPTNGTTVTLDATGTRDPDGQVTDHVWRIEGADGPRNGTVVEYTFDEPGTYSVDLTATDDTDQSATLSRELRVSAPTPTPTATSSPTPTPAPTVTPTPTATPTATAVPTATPTVPPAPTGTAADESTGAGQATTASATGTPVSGTASGSDAGANAGEAGAASTATAPSTPAANAVGEVSLPRETLGGVSGVVLLIGALLTGRYLLGGSDEDTEADGTDGDGGAGAASSGGAGAAPPDGGEATPTAPESSGPTGSASTDGAPLGSLSGAPGGPPTTIPSEPSLTTSYAAIKKHDRIGSGGSADVYRATVATATGERVVALKEPKFQGTLHREVAERFTREAELWADLDDHPAVVTVLDWDEEPIPWLVMEYMDGGHLGDRAGEMGLRQAAWTAVQLTEAVTHAHEQSVVHLDLKPGNVLFRECPDSWDAPKVADWGLARLLLEHSQSVEGFTPQYAAPEQFDDDRGGTDQRTDIYQLGALLYHLFVGEPPFSGGTSSVMYEVLEGTVPPPSSRRASLPPELDEVLLRALATDPADRYQSVRLLREDLIDLYEE